jgi:membrane protein implicated in regulation of membrane protease activity
MFKWFIDKLRKLIRNNTGVSIKNFAVFAIVCCSVLILLTIPFLLIFEMCFNHTISTDLMGIAAVITSVATIVSAVLFPKMMSERNEKPFSPDDPEM